MGPVGPGWSTLYTLMRGEGAISIVEADDMGYPSGPQHTRASQKPGDWKGHNNVSRSMPILERHVSYSQCSLLLDLSSDAGGFSVSS